MRLIDADFNFAERVAKSALLTATKKNGEMNTMTVSWGGSGVLWGKEVCFVFVRPERYTFEFCENGEMMSLSFFGKERQETLALCGTKSGRDVDKFEACDLKYGTSHGACVFDDAEITVILKKLYAQDIDEGCFVSEVAAPFYQNGGYHRMYICEIKEIIAG